MAMEPFKSEMMRMLAERGFMHQCSDAVALDALAQKERVVGYIGFDCTAPSLHVGSPHVIASLVGTSFNL